MKKALVILAIMMAINLRNPASEKYPEIVDHYNIVIGIKDR